MSDENIYEMVQKKRLFFMIYNIISIVFVSGITFTFVIPGFSGFNWLFYFAALFFYFLVANVFVGLFKERLVFVFILSLILSALGMGWRFWLEWGEVSLLEHTNVVVAVGYPCILALIITMFYFVAKKIIHVIKD